MSQSISHNEDRLRNSFLIRGIYLVVTVVSCWMLNGSCFCHPKY